MPKSKVLNLLLTCLVDEVVRNPNKHVLVRSVRGVLVKAIELQELFE